MQSVGLVALLRQICLWILVPLSEIHSPARVKIQVKHRERLMVESVNIAPLPDFFAPFS